MTDSRSTDKLLVLANALKNVPQETINRVKSFELTWQQIEADTVVPIVKVSFYEPTPPALEIPIDYQSNHS